MAGTLIFLLLAVAVSLINPVTPFSQVMTKEWQDYLEHLITRKVHEHVWFDHLDETPEERVLWVEVEQPAGPSTVKGDQELSLPQLSHARRPSFMDYRTRVR